MAQIRWNKELASAAGPQLTGAAHELISSRGARLDSLQAGILKTTEVEGCILFLGGF